MKKKSAKRNSPRACQKRPAYASSRFRTELAAAKAALHEAAKTLAVLAKEEPRLAVERTTLQRVIHVHPTGDYERDIENLEDAIIKAGPGGVVLLKANDKSGKPRHFNLTKVDELFMEHEVTLKSEKNAVIKFNE
jgi:hypothetical protein